MPDHPRRPCRQLLCPGIADKSGYCEKHKPKAYERKGQAPKQSGYDARYRRVRQAAFHRDNGLCQMCLRAGRYEPATITHHIKPVLDYPELKYSLGNLVSLCRECHEKVHGRRRG